MLLESNRIRVLEKTIEKLVAYLRRLPLNPETYRQANAAEKLLLTPVEDITLRGAQFLPVGIGALGVQVKGLNVSVFTQDISGYPAGLQYRHKLAIFNALVRGITVELSLSDFKGWEKKFGPTSTGSVPSVGNSYTVPQELLDALLAAAKTNAGHRGYCLNSISEDELYEASDDIPIDDADLCPICLSVFETKQLMQKQNEFARSCESVDNNNDV